jgi:hypothetical protein
MGGTFFRVRYEIQFEEMNQEVFAESSKFAAEAIGAFRTVASLTLEEIICRRYEVLLQGHVKRAFDKAKFSTVVFAFSDSIALLCMALTFYCKYLLLSYSIPIDESPRLESFHRQTFRLGDGLELSINEPLRNVLSEPVLTDEPTRWRNAPCLSRIFVPQFLSCIYGCGKRC